MGELTAKDRQMFARYYGLKNIELIDGFWSDIYKAYFNELVPLPLAVNVENFRLVSDAIYCPPGKCGECCKYKFIHVTNSDLERLSMCQTVDTMKVLNDRGGLIKQGEETGIKGPCPFLNKDNVCTVHKFRPSICYTFPIQLGVEGKTEAGQITQQIHVRMRCKPALEAVKFVIIRALTHNKSLELLPDLSIIRRETNG